MTATSAHAPQPTLADLVERRFGLPTSAGRDRPATGTLADMLARRVCRRFRQEPISEETMELLFAAALSAPSKSDLQQASIVRLRDPDRRRRAEALMPSMPWIAGAAELLVFCGDNRRMRRIAELRAKPFPNDTLDMFMNAAVDAGLVMQAFITAAEAEGLGCCPLSLIRNQIDELGRLLALPAGVFPVAGLALGHPEAQGKLSLRLPITALVHEDTYDASGFEAELAAYDARRAALEPTPAGKQRYAERWGTLTEYTWSEDKARQYSVPERHNFGPYVRGQGFGLN
ncbi:MAG: nitroreductase family protein [Burkholderiales bacterium]|nr:nitroreductase family protein [Burkholderiales bacterium]